MPTTTHRLDQIRAYFQQKEIDTRFDPESRRLSVLAPLDNIKVELILDTDDDPILLPLAALYPYGVPAPVRPLVQNFITELNTCLNACTACLDLESGQIYARLTFTQPPGVVDVDLLGECLGLLARFTDILHPYLLEVITRRCPPSTAIEQLQAALATDRQES